MAHAHKLEILRGLIKFKSNTQKIWESFSVSEKKVFMSRLRHHWGVARHRIPFISYDFIFYFDIYF